MDSTQAKQVVRQAYQMYLNKDVAGLLAQFHDDVEWVGNESDVIPFAGSYHGKDQVAEFFARLDQAEEMITFEPQTFIAEDDQVAVTGVSSWRVKATGRTYDNPWAHVFTLRDGKVARFQQYNDTAAAETAFMPAPAAGQTQQTPARH